MSIEVKIADYLKVINKLTEHTEIVNGKSSVKGIETFRIQLKEDDFITTEDHPINVSDEFVEINNALCMGFFNQMPNYNNTLSIFWISTVKS